MKAVSFIFLNVFGVVKSHTLFSKIMKSTSFTSCKLYFSLASLYSLFFFFLLRYSWCTVFYVSGVPHSDSQFQILYSVYSYYKILAIFPVLYNVCLQFIYFVHSNLYLLIPTHVLPFPLSLSKLITTSLFSISINLFFWLHTLVCFIKMLKFLMKY